MGPVKNPFSADSTAVLYDSYRPKYHHLPFAELMKFIGKDSKCLDVACGTGHSTKALGQISSEVIGCDISESMLHEARKQSAHLFFNCPAEELPFADNYFDYLNVSMAFQWLEQEKFLQEAQRVLKDNGKLGIDNYGFSGKMRGHDNFNEKYRSFDNKNMPAIPRNKNYPELVPGFLMIHEYKYEHSVKMNAHEFTSYLMTRSNFAELRSEAKKLVSEKINDFYSKLFSPDGEELIFVGNLKLFQKIPSSNLK